MNLIQTGLASVFASTAFVTLLPLCDVGEEIKRETISCSSGHRVVSAVDKNVFGATHYTVADLKTPTVRVENTDKQDSFKWGRIEYTLYNFADRTERRIVDNKSFDVPNTERTKSFDEIPPETLAKVAQQAIRFLDAANEDRARYGNDPLNIPGVLRQYANLGHAPAQHLQGLKPR